jgi:Ca2+-binding RTX toxin-like protein
MLADIANVSGSQLLVHGTRNADRVRVESTSAIITVWLNGRSRAFLKGGIKTLVVGLRQGDDRLDLKTDLPALVYGDGGNDTIVGGSGNDSVYSGSDNDRVYGGDGNDFIDAYNGDDFIAPGAGRDSALAGPGIDELSYGDRKTGVDIAFEYRLVNTSPTESLITSECYLNVGPETDQTNDVEIVTGSAGDDTLSMVGTRNVPGVDASDPTIHERVYRISGGKGNDVIDVSQSISSLPEVEVVTRQIADGGEGDDTLSATARGETTLVGGNGNDLFNSTDTKAFEPVVDAGDGTDLFRFASGHGMYYAMPPGLENMTASSPTSDIQLHIFGNELSNRIVIEQTAGRIYVDARYGNDYIDARGAVTSGDRSVELRGGGGKDSIFGSSAGDILSGEAGDDYLFGSGGIDSLYGNAYDDVLDGGEGADYLYGGGGKDRAKADPQDAVIDSIETIT